MRNFKKNDPPSSIAVQILATALSLSPTRVPHFPPAPHHGRTPARLPNVAVGHRPGIPRTPRSRQPVRLAITAIPELTPVSEKPRKIRKTPSPKFFQEFS
jgi:hypothetical protein